MYFMTAIYEAFWQWFAANSERCLGLLTNKYHEPPLTAAAFETVVRQYCGKDLFAGLEWDPTAPLPRIIISSHGNYHYFAQVEAMVAAAPLTLSWEVVAFEPPRKADHFIHELFGRLPFESSDLRFRPLELYNNCYGIPPVITVYVDIPKPVSKKYRRAIDHMIYNVLGERSTILDISGIVVEQLSRLTEEQAEETAPIEMLPEFIVDLSPPVLGVDASGKLHALEQE
jgi:hypothetical protein